MKTLLITKSIICLIAMSIFLSCDDQDGIPQSQIQSQYVKELSTLYPGASAVEWSIKGTYTIADIIHDRQQIKVWFADNTHSIWQMSETEISYQSLPDAIKTTFKASEYKDYRVNEVEKLLRYGLQTVYIIEVENATQEFDLYYSEEGIFIKSIADSPDSDNQQSLPPTSQASSDIMQFITQKYPTAKIIDLDFEHSGTEVELIVDGKKKEMFFDSSSKWVYTKTEIRTVELPTAVSTVLKQAYADYRIDSIDYIESSTGEWYSIELERGNKEIIVKTTTDGSIIK